MSEPPPEGGYPAYHPPGETPITPWDPRRGPAPTPAMSLGAWSFALALLPLLVTNLVSLVLAAITLARSRDGRNHGRGFAIVAIVVDLLVLPAWALAVILLTR